MKKKVICTTMGLVFLAVVVLIATGCQAAQPTAPTAPTIAPTAAVAAPKAPTVAPTTAAAAPTSAGTTLASKPCPNPHGKDGKCRVAFVDSFAANDTNLQWQKYARIAAAKNPYLAEWDWSQNVTDFSAEAQNAVLDNLLAKGVDAIVFNSVGDHSADAQIKKACDQGVAVITFNITDKAGLCEYRIEVPWKDQWSRYAGKWFAKMLNCKGNVLWDKGISGLSVSQDITDGQMQGIQDVCGTNNQIKVVGEYYGEYTESKTGAEVAALLSTVSQPIDAVMGNQGYCVVIGEAFQKAGRPVPMLNCQGFNESFDYLDQAGRHGWINAGTGAPIIGAMDAAYKVLHGQKVPKIIWNDAYWVSTDPQIDVGTPKPVQKPQRGVNWYPDQGPKFFVNWSWADAAVVLTYQEATGK